MGDINVGDEHTCASRSQFKEGMTVIDCWGSNSFGQTDLPHKLTNNWKLAQSEVQISAGGAHSCVLVGMADSSSLDCWGSDSHGQTKFSSYYSTNLSQVSAAAVHTCVIRLSSGFKNHSVLCWGAGYKQHGHVLGALPLNP